jgi:peptidylprolyl isomerase
MQAKRGDQVKVHYTGSLEDGTTFDSSVGSEPLEFTIGQGQVIEGFEDAIVGMSPGEKKTETIPSEQAYGARDESLIFRVDRAQMPEGTDVQVGDFLQVGFPDGSDAAVQVAGLDEQSVMLDANHPMAGKTLIFDLTLVGIV